MKIVSLFSGAGGLDLGLIKAGHEVIWANDFDKDCTETYQKNISDHIHLGDIRDFEVSSIPDSDVIVGGFPCQGFSLANLKRHRDDERNILYTYFLRIVSSKQPRYFLAENVRGILSLDGGAAISKIVDDFRLAGYRVRYKLFNAADFGVPQARQRVIIAGTRLDVPDNQVFLFPYPTHSKSGGQGLEKWVTIGEALASIPEPDAPGCNLPNHIYSKYKVTNRNFTGHRWTDPMKPSPTILARGNGKGGVCAIQHPSNHRRLSVRESATIQTFPLDFEFVGAMNSCYRQVGNAVAVQFAWHLGTQLTALEEQFELCA